MAGTWSVFAYWIAIFGTVLKCATTDAQHGLRMKVICSISIIGPRMEILCDVIDV